MRQGLAERRQRGLRMFIWLLFRLAMVMRLPFLPNLRLIEVRM
jgi:hypothetical protein